MHGDEDDGSSLLHALKDRPRTTHAHTLAHMEAGRITQNVEETGRLLTKSKEQILDERKKLMYTRRPVIETLALVSYELQMFQRQFAPRPEGIHKLRSKSKSANQVWGVDLHKLRDVRKPRQRILGLKISKDDIPSLKMADASDSDSDFSGEEGDMTQKAARLANHHGMSSGSRSGTTPHTAYSSMHASGAASHSTSRAASRPLSPVGETHHKALHKYRKAPKWQKAVQKKNASVAFEAQSSEVETKTQQEEAIAAIKEDPGQAVSNFFPAPWSTNWAPELEGSEPTPAPLGWEALPKRKPAAGPTAPTEAQQFSNRDFHHLFTRTKSRAVVPKAAHHAPEVGPSQEGVQIGSSFVLGAPADAEQQAAHLEKQGRQQQERLMQERFELDRLRMQQQEMLIQQQQEQERQAELEGERSLNISSSKPRLHRGPSAKGEGERSLEATPSRSGRDPRRSHFGEGAREQQLQQMSPGHGLVRRPNEGGQVGIQSTPSASVGAQEQNLVSRPQMPDDMSYEDIKLPKCLSGVSAISRTERSIKGSSRSMLHFKSSKGSRSAERGGSAEVDGRPKSTDSPKQQGKAMRECDDGEQSMEVPPQNSRPSGAYISMEDSGGKELFDKEDGAPPPNSMTWPAGQSPSPTVRDGLLTPAESELLSHSSTKDRGTPKGRRPASSPVQGRPDSPTALTAAADRDTLGPSPDASGHEGGIASSSSASRTSFGARDASSRSFSSAGAIASTGVGARKDLSKIGGAPQQALRGRQRRASAPYSPLKDLPDTASHVGQDGEQPLHQQEKEGSPLQQRGSAAPGFDTEVQRELLSHLSVNSSSVSGAKGVEARHAENEDGGHDQIKQALKKSSEPSDGSAGDPTLAGTRTTQSESQTRRGVKESRGAALKPSSPASMAKSNAWINENVPGKKNGNASPVIPAPDLPDAAAVQADSSSDPQPSFSLPPRIVSSSVSSSPRGHVPIRQVQVSAATQQDLCAVVAKVNPVAESARVGGDSVVPAADAAAALTSSATELKPNSPAQAAAAAAAATAAAESRPHAEPQPGVSDEVGNRDLTGSASPPPASPPQSPRLGRALNRKASPPKTHSSASATLHGTTRRAATRLGRVGAKEEGPREHSNALTASCNGASMPLNSSAYPPGYKWTMAQVSAILQSRHAANVQSSRGNHLTQTALMRPKEGDSQIKGGLELVEQLASLHRQLANPKGTAAPAPTPTSLLSAPSSPNISPPRRATSASAPSAFFGSTRAPQSGPFMQHHLYHHASPQQQVHRDKQRSLHHNLSAPTPFSLSSTPLAPTPLNPAPPLTPCGTKAHSLSGNTQQTEGMDQPTSPKILMLPTAEEALHTTASDSPLKPQASVSWPATPPGTAKQGPLPADTLAPPPSSHMSLPASLPASPASSCTADRACSPSSGGRTRNLSLSPRGSHALSAAERGPTPHPWTPSLQAPRFLHPSPSLSSAGTHCSPVSSQISKSPLPGCDLEVPWGGMRSQSEATHTLKESSLILSLLRSVRGALPPNSIAHQHHPRPRTSERFSAPSSTIKSSPASLRKLASPSPIDASPAAPLIPALLLRSTPPSVPSSKSPQQHKGTFGTASDAPSLGHHHPHANQPSRHAPFPISVDPCPLLPAASPLQHHQPLPTPPLLWPASPLSHPTQPNSPPYSVSSLEKPARVGESIPVNRKPLLARCPSIMYQHPKSRVGLYDATHLRVPPLSNVDPLDLGEGCPPEVQELLLQKLGGWLPHEIGGAAAHSPVGTCCGKTSAGECQRDGDRQDVGGEEQQSMQCRGRQTTTAHGPWPADHSKCAGPMCRAAQVGKAQWWAPGDDDWPFAQGGPASGADRAGLRQQLMSSFAQFG